jgi:cell division protein FtsN
MEFLRRNWVDLLMAALIATVIAAVLFLLLSGGKLFAPRANNAVSSTPTPVTTPVVPAPVTPNTTVTKPSSPEIPAPKTPNKPVVKPVTPAKPSVAVKPKTPSVQAKPALKPVVKPKLETINVPEIPVVEKPSTKPILKKPANPTSKQVNVSKVLKPEVAQTQKSVKPNKPIVSVKKPQAPATQAPKPKVAQTKKPITTQESVQNRAKPKVQVSRSSYLSSYRIVVGSYKTSPRAETFAAQVRSRGYPAQAVLSQGLYLVIVGPYSLSSSAENVFSRLKTAYPGAVLYRPNGSRSGSAQETKPTKPAQGSSGKPPTLNSKLAKQATTKTSMTIARPIPKLSTTKQSATSQDIQTAYLQVGSFRNAASASPLLLDLRKAGYVARLRVSSNGTTRVIIGPLTGTPLELARADLRSRGLQPFTIR